MTSHETSGSPDPAVSDPEKLARILNSGLDFMAGLMEMAGGQRIGAMEDRQITVDPDTGKISLSFRLPKPL